MRTTQFERAHAISEREERQYIREHCVFESVRPVRPVSKGNPCASGEIGCALVLQNENNGILNHKKPNSKTYKAFFNSPAFIIGPLSLSLLVPCDDSYTSVHCGKKKQDCAFEIEGHLSLIIRRQHNDYYFKYDQRHQRVGDSIP